MHAIAVQDINSLRKQNEMFPLLFCDANCVMENRVKQFLNTRAARCKTRVANEVGKSPVFHRDI